MTPYWRFFWATVRHKWYVFLAGLRVGGIPLFNLIFHDWVKFTPAEFPAYARKFYADYPDTPEAQLQLAFANRRFAHAWLHHENRQRHHWGYWVPRSGWYANKPLIMPEECVREMVADFLGAGREYTGSWDMSDWLTNNFDNVQSQMNTISGADFAKVLNDLGYTYSWGKWRRFKPARRKYPSALARWLGRWLDSEC